MRCGRLGLLSIACLVLLFARPARAAELEGLAADEHLLKEAKIATDGPGLLSFFRERTLTGPNRARAVALVQKLGNPSYRIREQASVDLVSLGSIAVPLLREAAKDPDLEVSRRATRCLEQIDTGPGAALVMAAARMLAHRKAAGAAAVLLNYLSDAPDDSVADEVRTTLAAVAVTDGKPELALVEALTDQAPLKRAAAGEALCRAGAKEQRPALHRLLKDPDTAVRLRVALALGLAKDKEAIPVLIALLGELPREQGWQAEDFLLRVADDQAPTVTADSEEDDRRKRRAAWEAWWQKHGGQVDLAKLERTPQLLGLTMIAQWDDGQIGRVLELGPDGKIRREVLNIPWPIDFQLLPGNKLLLSEYYINKVTERNFKGEQLWEKNVSQQPLAAQRLANGNTFIVMRGQLLEVDRTGKDVVTLNQPGQDVVSAIKTRNGQIYLVTMAGQFKRLDAAGKELKTFSVGAVHGYAAIDVLPSGRVLVPQYNDNKVVEYDTDGKAVWEAAVQQPTAPVRLPNGHTLVACRDAQLVIELDRNGKQIWQYKATTYPWRVRRR
jgi:HEAT repeat protein/outer membrane protein assembly factor BamB